MSSQSRCVVTRLSLGAHAQRMRAASCAAGPKRDNRSYVGVGGTPSPRGPSSEASEPAARRVLGASLASSLSAHRRSGLGTQHWRTRASSHNQGPSSLGGGGRAHSNVAPGAAVSPSTSAIFDESSSDAAADADEPRDLSAHSTQQLSKFRALVLDVSYRPIDTVPWTRAVVLDFFDKVDVLEYYNSFVRSARDRHLLPAVVRVRVYVKKLRGSLEVGVPLTRKNVYARDQNTCQYCGATKNLTLDHVIPQSKGGGTTWENVVTACSRCNQRKGDKLLSQLGSKMKLRKMPKEPSPYEMSAYMISNTTNHAPKEWRDYLPPGTGTWIFDEGN